MANHVPENTSPEREPFATRLRRLFHRWRIENRMTGAEVAEAIGLGRGSQSIISRFETGATMLSEKNLNKIVALIEQSGISVLHPAGDLNASNELREQLAGYPYVGLMPDTQCAECEKRTPGASQGCTHCAFCGAQIAVKCAECGRITAVVGEDPTLPWRCLRCGAPLNEAARQQV